VLAQAVKLIEKFQPAESGQPRPKIVTYSSLEGFEIDLPKSPHYEYVEHWHKPIRHSDLTHRAVGLLTRMGF
jgi:hypothetical protein